MKRFNLSDIHSMIRAEFPFELTKDQSFVVERLAHFIINFRQPSSFIIRGYAGTGKTTLVGALSRALLKLRIQTILLAPTGRAAKVLANYSGEAAYTIHKKIYYSKLNEFGVLEMQLQDNPHKNTLFIVDEASMISDDLSYRSLLEDLFSYVQRGFQCKLLFIGDSAQLPPVGEIDSPALDLEFMQSKFSVDFELCELRDVIRQAKKSGILYNATNLRWKIQKEEEALPVFSIQKFKDIVKLDGMDLEDVLYQEYARLGREEIVMITKSNKRANMFNREIRNRIFGQQSRLSVGDFVMNLKNNYYWVEKNAEMGFIANGDRMEIMKIKHTKELYGFDFADVEVRFVDYPNMPYVELKVILNSLETDTANLSYEDSQALWNAVLEDYQGVSTQKERLRMAKNNPYVNALQLKFSYALTCHKTQGGQWDTVFIDQGYFTKESVTIEYFRWLYTALTRATNKVYLLNFTPEHY